MKLPKSYLIKAYLIASALILVVYSPGFCAQKKFPTAIISLLLTDSRPSMEDTATKAAANLGGPVNASLAILLAADLGYSWIQIVDAIEVGNLKADGSIPGVLPEVDPLGIITVNEQSLVAVEKTSLITVNAELPAIEMTELMAAMGKFENPGGDVLDSILEAICNAYTPEQIIVAIVTNTLFPDGTIKCLPADAERDECTEDPDLKILHPKGYIRDKNWSNCDPPDPPNIAGTWRQRGYQAIIVGFPGIYRLTGTGDGNFKHTGKIKWNNRLKMYEGDLADVEGFCCGNIGYIWIKVKNETTISVISLWTTPDGTVIKDNTEVWTDMTLYSRDVDLD
jgi:hypothetical protein